MLEKVQHRATRMIPGLAKLQYEDSTQIDTDESPIACI